MAQLKILDGSNTTLCIQYAYYDRCEDVYTFFDNWFKASNASTFEISCAEYTLKVQFTIFFKKSEGIKKYTIVCKVITQDIVSDKNYRNIKALENINVNNIHDILSLVIKVSNGSIAHFKDENIIKLIELQMERTIMEANF